jgi:hypothetical protein
MIPQTFPRLVRSFVSLALARNSLLAVLVAARVPESHRKGAKDAKGDSHASNSKLLVDSKKSESNRFPERTTVDDLPTA